MNKKKLDRYSLVISVKKKKKKKERRRNGGGREGRSSGKL
jgi:hypothetical protein